MGAKNKGSMEEGERYLEEKYVDRECEWGMHELRIGRDRGICIQV